MHALPNPLRQRPTGRAHRPTRPSGTPSRRLRVLVAGLALLAASSQATALTLDFFGSGELAATGPLDGWTQPFLSISNGGYTFNGVGGHSLYAEMVFDFGGTGHGSFTLGNGFDGVSGTLITRVYSPDSFGLAYTVTSGRGAYAGAVGGGNSVVTIVEDLGMERYRIDEGGQLMLTAVPEPASWALLLGGAGWLLARRKHLASAFDQRP